MKNRLTIKHVALAALLLSTLDLQMSTTYAQGTAFTYQGLLSDGGAPADGTYDLRFAIYDLPAAGTQQGNTLTNSATGVSNGVFTVTLDFGAAPIGSTNRWLQIGVRTNGGVFMDLTPRQRLNSTPYAVRALNATDAATATLANSVAVGSIGNAALQPGAVDSTKIADGSISVADLSVVVLSNTFWRLGGNAGTTPGVNFLGTTDNQQLVISVNGQQAMRFEPTTDTPNVVGGWIGNNVQPGLWGVTIGGGGTLAPFNGNPQPNVVTSNGYFATIAGGYNNTVQGYGGAVVGGSVNAVVGNFGVIGGGQFHTIGLDAVYSVIGGGYGNTIETNAQGAFVAGGGANVIERDTFSSSIGGGYGNTNGATFGAIGGGVNNNIESNNSSATIAGGQQNVIRENVSFGFIGGGTVNTIQTGSGYSVIAGGQQNTIEMNAGYSVIGGGWLNVIHSGADQSVVAGGNAGVIQSGARESFIGGGFANTIQTNAAFSFIGAGTGNVIGTNSLWGTIAGGRDNLIQPNSSYATIAGGLNNSGAGFRATVSGGGFNSILTNSSDSAIGGGFGNVVSNNTAGIFIGGGSRNAVGPFTLYGTIGGGWSNSIIFNLSQPTIGGGFANMIQNGGDYSFIGGGTRNTNSGFISLISGGRNNIIARLADHSVIGGGGDNRINGSQTLPVYAVVSGGQNNWIQTNAIYSTISGGISNTVQTGARYASIPGGASNSVAGAFGLAAGYRAKTLHDGSFVWADSTDADFASTATNQFSVRAAGGVRLETGGAGVSVDGLGVLAGSVSASQITDGAVTTAKIADGTIVNLDISASAAIADTKLATISTAGKVANSALSSSVSLLGQTIESAEITDGTIAPADLNLTAFNPTFWRTTGNAGTTPGTHFVGTTDGQPLTVKVNGTTALRIDPTDTAPNIVGGLAAFRPTVIGANVRGAVVAGGAAPAGPVNGGGAGDFHAVFDSDGAIGGGFGNKVGTDNNDPDDAPFATVAGGVFNSAGNYAATVAGGDANFAGGPRSMVGGGYGNWATGESAFLGGGNNNRAGGMYATVPGGTQNVAAGDSSFAAGNQAKANHTGSFVWADSQNADFASTTVNEFSVRAAGGVRMIGAGLVSVATGNGVSGISSGSNGIQGSSSGFGVSGVYGENFSGGGYGVAGRATGSGSGAVYGDSADGQAWAGLFNGDVFVAGTISSPSDRNVKRDFRSIDAREVLEKVAALPVQTWAYTNNPVVRHIGPVAQDFRAAFDLGSSDKSISTVDADGVALAAIQGLNQKLTEELGGVRAENAELKARLSALEKMVVELHSKRN